MSLIEAPAPPPPSPPSWLEASGGVRGRERRVHERLREHELDWLKTIRLKFGPSVRLVDLSAGGALLESKAPLRPGSSTVLTITGRGVAATAALRVLRCEVAKIDGGLVYRGACVFEQVIDLPARIEPAVADLGMPFGDASAAAVDAAIPGPGAVTAGNSGPVLDRVERPRLACLVPASQSDRDVPPTVSREAPALPEPGPASAGWSRLVVRFLDRQLLKGFSQDFNPSRPLFHLTPCIGGVAHRPVKVHMPQLKAVFFVRDFTGNASYAEVQSFLGPVAGRRIEVTFLDDEVIVGATLGYRPDGTGFFVTPADPKSNNLRIFVLPAAVRQIRYI